ncbi:hypothetical protein GOB94_03325 [Granulicella sp. 5B5]|uniref:hypothetical protein n=1 Tax=Granulicella sp. 5B5 TaxID=1617967 RepID=UPI0015F498C3|nr:hypothetical protein [Granulicella sp. 5B5]QMV17833.1 hypothetical protein GOB94_03325 [Granulicella sp. 5B5]
MTSTPNLEGKYQLKTLHAEIDLLDRRLAHLLKYDTFETEAARDAAARKIATKREPLAQTAKRLASEGVEYKESELPRSFRPEGVPAPVEVKAQPEAAPEMLAAGAENRNTRRHSSAHTGAVLDWEKSVAQYMQAKKN